MTGIAAIGAYAPRFRVSAEEFTEAWGTFEATGIREKAVPAPDEDALTMAYEAASRALGQVDFDGGSIDWVGLATSTPPLAEEDLTVHLGAMIGVPSRATRQFFGASTRAGTRAMWAAIDALETEREVERALVVVTDAPRGAPADGIEHAAGGGSAAFLLAPDGPAIITDRSEYSAAYPGTRYRQASSRETTDLGTTAYGRRAFIETIEGAVDGLDPATDPDAVVIQAPDGDLPYRAASEIGVDRETVEACAVVDDLGDLGAASVPVSLARALDRGYETILAVAHGSGGAADALLIDVDQSRTLPAILDLDGEVTVTYSEYLRRRGVLTRSPPGGGGAAVTVPTWQRSLPQRYRLEAGECSSCAAIGFPPDGACRACGERAGYERIELPGTGTIETATTISRGGAPPEFVELQAQSGDYATAIVAFDAGESTVSVPAMATNAEANSFEVGDRVEATIRRIYTQEGVTRYGFKVVPAEVS